MSRAKRRPRYTARGKLTPDQDAGASPTSHQGPAADRPTVSAADRRAEGPVPPAGSGAGDRTRPAPTPAAPLVAPAAHSAHSVHPVHPVHQPRYAAVPRSGPAGDAGTGPAPPGGGPRIGPRTIRLRIAEADPWSVMVTSFLFLTGLGVTVIGTAGMLWIMLEAMSPDALPALTTVLLIAIGIVTLEVILGTCLATLSSFIYNLSAQFNGGVEVAVTDAGTGPPPATPRLVLLMARYRVRARRYLRGHAPAWISGALHRLPAAAQGLPAVRRRLPADRGGAGARPRSGRPANAPAHLDPPKTAADPPSLPAGPPPTTRTAHSPDGTTTDT
ncbi:DUF3566 domain-containing protein [Streptomyces sp. NPDC015171]|uniref:DUF3566 domain-containing protein n=1 Tax=Streptomyces sp. NPDC015171 TaxID=3364945 RepID=UPI0036F5996E